MRGFLAPYPRQDFIEFQSGKYGGRRERLLGSYRHRTTTKGSGFELRAALSLAKLYQSTAAPPTLTPCSRPALEGFSPTPEFPEIEEAGQLLAALE